MMKINEILAIGEKYKLNKIQLAHLVGQCAHESANFTAIRENLNYSKDGLMKIFKKYFTPILAMKYARNPEMIANRVYANRMGNGNEQSGDGYKYRGRGFIQLTGKDNYTLFSKFIGEDCVSNPDLVATKYPLESALFYFQKNKLFDLCKNLEDSNILTITKRVNGGTHGFDDRKAKTLYYFKQF